MITKLNKGPHSKYEYYLVDTIPSTNTYFKENYKSYKDKSILIALEQTEGRGRYDRIWKSSSSDIIFSILLKENKNYAIIAPLAICLGLEKFNIKAGIKWPNDVYLNNKKLSGILIEDIFNSRFVASIVGIGINMTDKPSLYGVGLNLNNDKFEIINSIIEKFDELLDLDETELITLYRNYSTIINKDVYYQGLTYKVVDIDLNGHLVLSNLKGKITVSSDEINIKESLLKYENKN